MSTPLTKISTALGAGALLLGGVALAPAASAAPTAVTSTAAAAVAPDAVSPLAAGPRTALVTAWYEQFLGRSATDDPGSQYWVVRLRTEDPAVVLADLLRTREHVTLEIDDMYSTYLGRGIAGDPGAAYWADGVVRGDFPLEWVEQNVLGSAEFADGPFSDTDVYETVQAWYSTILGRLAAPGEEDYWVSRLDDASPLQVVREIWYTPEAVGFRVASHYEDYLQRSAGPGEIAYWAPREVASDVGVVVAVASSQEYQDNAPTFLP